MILLLQICLWLSEVWTPARIHPSFGIGPPPPPPLRKGCPALRPCAEEASAGNSMGSVLAGIPTTPSTTDLSPSRCPTESGASPSPADGRRH
ncbi:hypothetical protein CgunFtcFv8_017621 [Champsocephalus gunnari]|uniref:Secreted protein n=1 Tax=Champsocephalus gunnari TaxID=52237 RepID=A0AAN8DSP1_CHAGU|nr:hypothetical protein CgunFtcFv8_017621 [Champsocephalus gunnari]